MYTKLDLISGKSPLTFMIAAFNFWVKTGSLCYSRPTCSVCVCFNRRQQTFIVAFCVRLRSTTSTIIFRLANRCHSARIQCTYFYCNLYNINNKEDIFLIVKSTSNRISKTRIIWCYGELCRPVV